MADTAFQNVVNNADSTIDGAINGSVTSVSVQTGDAAKFPAANFLATIIDTSTLDSNGNMDANTVFEIVQVTNVATDVFTIVRAQEGTSGTSFDDGDIISHNITAGMLSTIHTVIRNRGIEGLVGYWPLNEGTGTSAADLSENTNTGTITAGTWTTDSVTGPVSLEFNGATTKVDVGSDSTLDDIAQLTLALWMKADGLGEGSQGRLFSKGWFVQVQATEELRFTNLFSGTNGTWSSSSNELTHGVWHHVVITYDNSATTTNPIFYVDGQTITVNEDTTPTGAASSDAGASLIVGNETGQTTTFDGHINEVMVFNRILSAEEVQRLYRATSESPTFQSLTTLGTITAPNVLISANVDTALLSLLNPGDLQVDFRIDAGGNDFHIDTNNTSDVIKVTGTNGNVTFVSDLIAKGAITTDEDESVDDATPTTANISLIVCDPTGILTITSFDDGTSGQLLTITNIDSNVVTINNSGNIVLINSAASITLAQNQGAQFVYITTDTTNKWIQVGGST